MIYRVTLPNGETLHKGHGPLADVWLNRHGGKLERIPLASIKSVACYFSTFIDNGKLGIDNNYLSARPA